MLDATLDIVLHGQSFTLLLVVLKEKSTSVLEVGESSPTENQPTNWFGDQFDWLSAVSADAG